MLEHALSRWERRLRPLLTRLPPGLAVRLYSAGRRRFAARFEAARPSPWSPPPELARTLWGLEFRAPLLNAAGVFKTGEGYGLVARQGAGGYLAGTTTGTSRDGNRENGVRQPFAPYPRSGAASNKLGLPNPGHAAVARRLADLERVPGCPVGMSLSATPGLEGDAGVVSLVEGLGLYADAGVDFVEINESCPNTENAPLGADGLVARLEALAEGFLVRRPRPLPVLVKLSCDTAPGLLPELLDRLLDLGFDGLNLGNTSVAYARHRGAVAAPERPLYDHFVEHHGGGVSGRPLAADSLALVRAAAAHLARRSPEREFHLVRTGGVETAADVAESLAAGASLVGWYTGYFEAFAEHGHGLYRHLFTRLLDEHPVVETDSP